MNEINNKYSRIQGFPVYDFWREIQVYKLDLR